MYCFFHYFVVSMTEKYNHDQEKTREDKTNFSLSTVFRHRIWCITINTEYKNLQKKI